MIRESEIEKLSMITHQEYSKRTKDKILVIDNIVYNVGDFLDWHHLGSRDYLTFYLGKDASNAFNREVYKHSNCTRNILKLLLLLELILQILLLLIMIIINNWFVFFNFFY